MQNLRAVFVGAFVLSLVANTAAFAGQPQGTSEKDREKVVEYATRIERDPLSKKARSDRKKVLTIIRRAPDLRVESCHRLLGELLLSKKLGATELLVHQQIASARYLAENPDMRADRMRVLHEGVVGVLRAYRMAQQRNPLVQIEFLDELIERHENGELDAYIGQALAECP